MSFAAGFQAGSGAVERGLRLRAMREEKENEEAYQAAAAGLSQQYQAGQQAQADYGAQQQANLDAGMALASPVPPSGNSAGALLANAVPGAMGTQGAQMSPVAPQAGGLSVPGATPQAAYMTPPEAMSYTQYQRGLADLAMQYGNTDTALSLMSAAEAADRAERLEALRRSEYAQDYALRVNADARAEAEATRAATEADYAAKALEGKAKIDALINQGTTDRSQFDGILSEYGKYGVNVAYLGEALEASRGITRGQIEAEALQIQGDLRGITTFESLIDYYNESDSLSPGYKLELTKNDETGLFDLNHFDDKGNKIDRDVASFRTKQEADVYLRQLAVDPTTAMQSLVERDNARRTAAAEAALEEAKLAVEKYGDDMGYKKEELKAVAAGIKGLRDDQTFFMLDPADRDARIKRVYTDLGLEPPSSLGVPDLEDDATPPPKGAGLAAIEAAQTARAEKEKGERTVTSEAEEILSYKTGRGLFGSADEELYNIGYEKASPEVKAEIDRILEVRARRDAAVSEASGRYGLGSIYR